MSEGGRLVFSHFEFERFPDGGCRARVELTKRGGDRFVGMSEGKGAQTVALRCSAQATVNAIQQFVGTERLFELIGAKAVHAFDSIIAIVSVAVSDEDGRKSFVGTYVVDEGPERGAAIAVLSATNRYVANKFAIAQGSDI